MCIRDSNYPERSVIMPYQLKSADINMRTLSFGAVSYTHLDVYKRQSRNSGKKV